MKLFYVNLTDNKTLEYTWIFNILPTDWCHYQVKHCWLSFFFTWTVNQQRKYCKHFTQRKDLRTENSPFKRHVEYWSMPDAILLFYSYSLCFVTSFICIYLIYISAKFPLSVTFWSTNSFFIHIHQLLFSKCKWILPMEVIFY